MDNLAALVKSLSPGERTLIKHFYKLREFGEYRKRGLLLNHLQSTKFKTEKELAQAVGYKTVNTSYHNLKSRLKSDITSILLLQEPSAKFNTPYAQAVFNCRRAILTGEIILNRGIYNEGINLLKKASKIAEKFELFAEQIIIDDTLRNYHAASSSNQEVQQTTASIEHNYGQLGKMMQSKKSLYESIFNCLPSEYVEDMSLEYGKSSGAEVESTASDSNSIRISFYNRLSKVNVLNSRGEFQKALKCALEIQHIAENDPIIMSKANQAGIHLEIATIYLKCANYSKAIHHAEIAKTMFKNGMVNNLKALTILFYSQAHSKMCAAAANTLEEIMTSNCLKEPGFSKLLQKIHLVNAWFHFTHGETKRSATSLKICSEISKEKSAWSEGFILLECMLLIEKRSFDIAIYKLEALKKNISRKQSSEQHAARILAIINVLRQLIRNNGDYETLMKSNSKYLEQLKSERTHWDPMGFEVVQFEEWLQTRALQKVA